jgi:hypothetical protein
LSTEVSANPANLSAAVISIVETVSANVITPVAGVFLAYAMASEIMALVMEKNNMAEFDLSHLFWILIKTSLSVLLVSYSFDICMGLVEAGNSLVTKAISAGSGELQSTLPNLGAEIAAGLEDDLGQALLCFILAVIAWVSAFAALIIINLVVWTRILMLMIYISIAPLPFATLLSKDWLGQIGQNYLKNLFSYALQGFLMVVCVLIYGAVGAMLETRIMAQPPTQAIAMIIASMYVCVATLAGCHKLAKSIFNAA